MRRRTLSIAKIFISATGGKRMLKKSSLLAVFLGLSLWLGTNFLSYAQQTLGGITGQVVDTSGGALPGTTVNLVGDQTQLTRSTTADATGVYNFVNLPIGNYTLTFTHDGFQTQNVPSILVQANRTATVNATLKVGEVSQSITVQETPLTNAVDTTNGYVLDTSQLQAVPLPTGSFTGLAILSPGVNAELESGTGANNGLGNQPIWANGQRDTSNTFLLNGVDASNLFNGKSTSSVDSARVVNNTGVAGASASSGEPIQSTASPYLAIGQALPTPPQETIAEVRVNTSMYDAQQGGTSGAHIDLSTASGTNNYHGQLYGHRGTDAWNAMPYFNNENGNIPAADKVPELHRYTAGGTFGGPIIKNKIFGFVGYQHLHSSDQEIGTDRTLVPPGLTSNRSAAAIAALTAAGEFAGGPVNVAVDTNPGDINPIAFTLLNYKLKNGQYLFPSADQAVASHAFTPSVEFPEDVFIPNTARFIADQAVANLDILATSKDTLALKYYYQHDPTTSPYAFSGANGFDQHLDAGSQVASLTNTQIITPNFNVAEVLGFIREKAYSTVDAPFTPGQLATACTSLVPTATLADCTIDTFGSNAFPGISIVDDYGNNGAYNTGGVFSGGTTIGMGAASQGAFTGVFQNRWMPSASAIWIHGKHTITFGGSYAYTQLNTRDERTNNGMIGFTDFSSFLQGSPLSYSANGFIATTYLQGNANRYMRSNDTGEYVQDKYQIRPNLSLSVGLRYDYHGGMTEKDGELYNFDPSLYSYDRTTDSFNLDSKNNAETGFVIAGNNKLFPTKGVSASTLTGRQWGLSPRLGVAWSPKAMNDKLVVRAGWGIYYDRGELFTYLSPGFASGVIAGGPFGFNQSPPWVASQQCSIFGYSPCNSFEDPWDGPLTAHATGNPADIERYMPNNGTPGQGIAAGIEEGEPLFSFGVYNRANKLPYTLNQTLDVQWQPRNDLAIEIGYVGNLGRHEVVPVPFNQAGVATPSHPLCGGGLVKGIQPVCPYTTAPSGSAIPPQFFTYGYSVVTNTSFPYNSINLPAPDGGPYQQTFEGGNVDLRVPYIGYSAESLSYDAAGVSAYHALQAHVEKRLSHGIQIGASYTYSHSLDEQSGLGLFYTGNNPTDLHSGYGNSDFDRTHVFNFSYLFKLHSFAPESSLVGKFLDGWALQGITVIQSGQPYSVVDYSGAVGSIYYGVNDGVTNPIVPLAPGCTPQNAVTKFSGAQPGTTHLRPECFTVPLLAPGALNGAIPSNDPYETTFVSNGQRNIFRQAWQRRADISIVKTTKLNERFTAKYTFDVYNLTNTPSFDIPLVNVDQNLFFNGFPLVGTTPSPTSCDATTNTGFYSCPILSGFGLINKTIGSMRQIQMSLSLTF
jgi:hypothetical protein